VPVDKVSDELLSLLFAELSPVCAIVGGVLAQEVIKVSVVIGSNQGCGSGLTSVRNRIYHHSLIWIYKVIES
jgi:hypothetical protein